MIFKNFIQDIYYIKFTQKHIFLVSLLILNKILRNFFYWYQIRFFITCIFLGLYIWIMRYIWNYDFYFFVGHYPFMRVFRIFNRRSSKIKNKISRSFHCKIINWYNKIRIFIRKYNFIKIVIKIVFFYGYSKVQNCIIYVSYGRRI